jgi:hypothetical protein
VRIRPLSRKENEERAADCTIVVGTSVYINSGETKSGDTNTKSFSFDGVYKGDVGPEVFYNQVARPIVAACLKGYNGTIFAYGQTGSGKVRRHELYTYSGP